MFDVMLLGLVVVLTAGFLGALVLGRRLFAETSARAYGADRLRDDLIKANAELADAKAEQARLEHARANAVALIEGGMADTARDCLRQAARGSL